jgi:hypothetical protein
VRREQRALREGLHPGRDRHQSLRASNVQDPSCAAYETVRLREIVLRTCIRLREGPSGARVRKLVEQAHRECYVASSRSTPVRVEAQLEFVD